MNWDPVLLVSMMSALRGHDSRLCITCVLLLMQSFCAAVVYRNMIINAKTDYHTVR